MILERKSTSMVSIIPNMRNEDINLKFVSIYNWVNTEEKSRFASMFFKIEPQVAVMGMLDKIFDYLTIEELEKFALVCKFFCYVATLDKLYEKYGINEDFSSDLSSSPLSDSNFDKYQVIFADISYQSGDITYRKSLLLVPQASTCYQTNVS